MCVGPHLLPVPHAPGRQQAGESEVDQPDVPVAPRPVLAVYQKDIIELDVSVDDAQLMQVGQRSHQPAENESHGVLSDSTAAADVGGQGPALAELSDDAVLPIMEVGLIDLENIWMVELAQESHLVLHLLQLFGGQPRPLEHLGGSHRSRLLTDCPVDHPEPALSQFLPKRITQPHVFAAEAHEAFLGDGGWREEVLLGEDIVRDRLYEGGVQLQAFLALLQTQQALDAGTSSAPTASMSILQIFLFRILRGRLRPQAFGAYPEERYLTGCGLRWSGRSGGELEDVMGGSNCSVQEGAVEELSRGVITQLFLQFWWLNGQLSLPARGEAKQSVGGDWGAFPLALFAAHSLYRKVIEGISVDRQLDFYRAGKELCQILIVYLEQRSELQGVG